MASRGRLHGRWLACAIDRRVGFELAKQNIVSCTDSACALLRTFIFARDECC